MRYEHYQRVVQWDRRQRFPERGHRSQIPSIRKVTRVWSLIGLGFKPNQIPAAARGLERRTGQKAQRVYTKKSVAQRRLKEGDPVGVQVKVDGKAGYERREQVLVRIFPETRPFRGFPVLQNSSETKDKPSGRTKGIVDQHGQVTFHFEQPGGIPARAPYYEGFYSLVSGSTGTHRGGRYRSIHTTAKTERHGLALREGRRFPLVQASGSRS